MLAVLSLVGKWIRSFSGIIAANKLVNYRLQQLEAKVQTYSEVVERAYKLEGRMAEV